MNVSINEKDLKKIKEYLSRTEDLPFNIIEDIDFKGYLSDDEEERRLCEIVYDKKKYGIFKNLDELLIEIRAFIKLKFGKESEYFKLFTRIHFDSKGKGVILNTFNINHNKYWQKGTDELHALLRNIEAEIKLILETNSDELVKLREREKRSLNFQAKLIFIVLVSIIPILSTVYFVKTLINWKTLNIIDPLTWVNQDKFGKLEFLVIVVEIIVIGGSIATYKKFKNGFFHWYYNRFKAVK